MSESAQNQWSDGISLENIPYEEQPKVIVAVRCYETNTLFPDRAVAEPAQHFDITDWLQANPQEQILVLNQLRVELKGSEDLDDLGNLDELDDASSGDHLVGLDEPGLPAGNAGTDIHLLSAYAKYLKDCRDRDFIPFSDISGHAERAQNARHVALNDAHGEILAAVERYTALAQANAALAGNRVLFSDGGTDEQRRLWDQTRPLMSAS